MIRQKPKQLRGVEVLRRKIKLKKNPQEREALLRAGICNHNRSMFCCQAKLRVSCSSYSSSSGSSSSSRSSSSGSSSSGSSRSSSSSSSGSSSSSSSAGSKKGERSLCHAEVDGNSFALNIDLHCTFPAISVYIYVFDVSISYKCYSELLGIYFWDAIINSREYNQ